MSHLCDGDPVPRFSLKGIDNQMRALSGDPAGGPLILFFFVRERRECRAAFPVMERLARRARRSPGGVWGLTGDSHGESLETADQFQLSFPILLDRRERVREAYGIAKLPAFALVRRDRTLAGVVEGWDEERVRQLGVRFLEALELEAGDLGPEDDWLPGA